jgi:lipoprotein NlpI
MSGPSLRSTFKVTCVGVLASMGIVAAFIWLTSVGENPSFAAQRLEQALGARVERALQKEDQSEIAAVGAEIDQAMRASPSSTSLMMLRGMLLFRTKKIKESLVDFDRIVELEPSSEPFLWQRGLALYYAGEFEKAKQQFVVHRTVNPNDVENAFWHFLCGAKIDGVEKAKNHLLLAGQDRRSPLMEVQKMIAGEMTVDDVLAVTKNGTDSTKFYGYLYLGLYADALGTPGKAKEYLKLSVQTESRGYMHDVAKLHLWSLEKE